MPSSLRSPSRIPYSSVMKPPSPVTMLCSASIRLISETNADVWRYLLPRIMRTSVCMVMIDMQAFIPCPEASPTIKTTFCASTENTS